MAKLSAKTKPQHPGDIAANAKIADAVSFNVHLRISPTVKHNREAASLAEAMSVSTELEAIPGRNGRKPIIYAIMADGTSVPVPPAYLAQIDQMAADAKAEALTTDLTGSALAAAWVKDLAEKTGMADDADVKAFIAENAPADAGADLKDEEVPAFLKRNLPAVDLNKGEASPADAEMAAAAATRNALAPAKPARKPREAKAPKEAKPLSSRAQVEVDAEKGILPQAPDFSADTHKNWRKRLASIVEMVGKADIKGLKADTTEPKSSSRAMLCRYRDLSIKALEFQKKAAKEAAKQAA